MTQSAFSKISAAAWLLAAAFPFQSASADPANERMRREADRQMLQQGYCQSVYGNAGCVPPSNPRSPNCIANPHHVSCPRDVRRVPRYTPEQWAQIQSRAGLLDAQMPVRCTPLENGTKRCWQGWFGKPDERALQAVYPKVDLYVQNRDGEVQGWKLEYGRGRLLWATFWKDGQPVANINFRDAPAGRANAVVYGEREQTASATEAEGLRSIGIAGMNLQDTMHPDDFHELISALGRAQRLEREHTRRYGD